MMCLLAGSAGSDYFRSGAVKTEERLRDVFRCLGSRGAYRLGIQGVGHMVLDWC